MTTSTGIGDFVASLPGSHQHHPCVLHVRTFKAQRSIPICCLNYHLEEMVDINLPGFIMTVVGTAVIPFNIWFFLFPRFVVLSVSRHLLEVSSLSDRGLPLPNEVQFRTDLEKYVWGEKRGFPLVVSQPSLTCRRTASRIDSASCARRAIAPQGFCNNSLVWYPV